MSDGFNSPVCILKTELQCCDECPTKMRSCLQKLRGVSSIEMNATKGFVMVSGTAKPAAIVKSVKRVCVAPRLYAYESDPKTAKLKFGDLMKDTETTSSEDDDDDDDDNDDPGGGCGGEIHSGRNSNPEPAFEPSQNPASVQCRPPAFMPQSSEFTPQHPAFMPQHPAFMSQHPAFMPQNRATEVTPSYPASVYHQQDAQTCMNIDYDYFSDENANGCSIM